MATPARPPRGTGPVARVQATVHPQTGRPVAVKLYPHRPDRRTLAAFDRERLALGRLRLAASVLRPETCVDWPDGSWGVVTELCPQSFAELVASAGPLPVFELAGFGEVVASVLAEAHQTGLVHGGVTPANLLFRGSGQPVLSDFGLSLRQHFPRRPEYEVSFAAPELLRGDEPDIASDLYGLGCLLYLGLTGRAPFPAVPGEIPSDQVLRVLSEPAPAVTGVPAELARLVSRLLAKEPAGRPGDAAEVAAVLRAVLVADAGAGPDGAAAADPDTSAPDGGNPDGGAGAGFDDFRDELPATIDDPVAGARPLVVFGPDGGPARSGRRATVGVRTRLARMVRSARGWLAAAVVAAAVLAVVPVLLGPATPDDAPPAPAPSGAAVPSTGRPSPSATGTPASPAEPAVTVVLAPPVDRRTSVTLRWQAPPGLTFAVVIAKQGQAKPITRVVGRRSSYAVPVEPGLRYCFKVQAATDLRAVYESQSRPIRGATCKG